MASKKEGARGVVGARRWRDLVGKEVVVDDGGGVRLALGFGLCGRGTAGLPEADDKAWLRRVAARLSEIGD